MDESMRLGEDSDSAQVELRRRSCVGAAGEWW